ncbi:MAG TPA: AimR family lysis-lysogeny pheromone receptor, partial [Bacillota bacterium]|nr:AimR family lysis-lysogeny pheromone receptor [Bacillota bacterium]
MNDTGLKMIELDKIDDNMKLEYLVTHLTMKYDKDTAKKRLCECCLHELPDYVSKFGMEFFYINGYVEELKMLIDKHKASVNKSNRNWAEAYQLSSDYFFSNNASQSLMNRDILEKASNIKTDEPALICLIEFLKLTVYNQMSEFSRLGNFLDVQPRLFDQIDDQYLKKSFQIRLYQNLFMFHWARNELIMARKYAFQVLNLTTNAKVKINMHMNLGLTYTFDTYDQGMYHLREALILAKQHEYVNSIRQIENHNVPFLSAHFKKVDGVTSSDDSERAHIEIAKGYLEKAKTILDRIEINSPFKLYYLG